MEDKEKIILNFLNECGFQCSNINMIDGMHIARELCGGQICVTPNAATFSGDETGKWMKKFYTINQTWQSDDRRKLLAYARDLLIQITGRID